MKKLTLLIVFLCLLGFAAGALAQESGLPDSGTTPDSKFYFLKAWKEQVRLFFTFGAENKAKQFLHLAEVRLAEYQKMIEAGKTEIAQKTLDKYERQLNQAVEKAQEAQKKGGEDLTDTIKEKRVKYQETLGGILEKVPAETKEGIISERQEKWMVFITEVHEKFPALIPEVVGSEVLPIKLFNCPVPLVPAPESCEGGWQLNQASGCPYFSCPSASKRQAQEPPKPADLPKQGGLEKPAESPVCIQVITPATGPDGKCKEFPTPCEVPTGWKKVDACPRPTVAPLPVPVSTPAPTQAPIPIPVPAKTSAPAASSVACCNASGGCKLVDTRETCLGMSGKPMSISSCSPNPCPQPTPVYNECKQGPMKDYKCPGGTLVKWQCKCTAEADGEETRLCSVKPAESCPAGAATLTITSIDVRHLLWMTKEWTIVDHIFWTTNIPATSYVEYGPTTSYGFTTPPESPTTQHVAQGIPNLERNTIYHFRIIAEDAHGHKIISDDYTFTTGL